MVLHDAYIKIWEFPKIGDPNIVPLIVGSLLQGSQYAVPLIFGNAHTWLPATRFPSRPLMIKVPFFLLFGFNKGTQKEKG